jgi:hypothetical protein
VARRAAESSTGGWRTVCSTRRRRSSGKATYRSTSSPTSRTPRCTSPRSPGSPTAAAKHSEIAGLLGRSDSGLNHPLEVLQELRLIARVEDALRSRRPIYQLTEPVIWFQQLVIRPREATLAARRGLQVWRDCADTVAAKIYGPHLEDIARAWVLAHADARSLGGCVNEVRPATIACREHKAGHELDVVALSDLPHEPVRVLAIGEVKATEKPVGEGELTRLEHLRGLLPPDKVKGHVKLLLFARSGFTGELRQAGAKRDDVELIDLARLCITVTDGPLRAQPPAPGVTRGGRSGLACQRQRSKAARSLTPVSAWSARRSGRSGPGCRPPAAACPGTPGRPSCSAAACGAPGRPTARGGTAARW